ncbi:cytosolic phospholipase A2 zeta-like protein [Labeo rohita]|nr:cytosolic phospholipase A2 zeta-like protein [Labeo rohita]
MLKKEVKPYWNLSVKVLYAKLHQNYDYWSASDCYVILNLPTASARTNRTKTISNNNNPVWNETFTFRAHSNIKNILEIMMYDEDPFMRDNLCATILFDISNLPHGKKETKCFKINDQNKDELWVEFEITKSSDEELDVRLDFDIPVEEKNFLVKRKKVVSQALQKALNLSSAPDPNKVPVMAVVCSGGGSRALIATYGSLMGLQKIQLLDAVSYITGVSGATWALGSIYEHPNWSKGEIDKSMEFVKKELTKKAFSMFSSEQLQEYKQRIEERQKEGYLVSLIDMWGLALEYLFHGKKRMGTLSELQKTVSEGQNPLPIFTAVNMKQGKEESIIDAEWCEFTPYEVGFPKYGAFVPAQNFGSEYYLGHMVKKLPETGLSFLVGMWSSIFSINLTDIWKVATGVAPSWTPCTGGVSNTETDSKPAALGTYLISPVTDFAKKLCGLMTSRPIVSQMYNFLRGFNLHNSYNENTGFIAWKGLELYLYH